MVWRVTTLLLREIGIGVRHILKDGVVEDHEKTIGRLLSELKMTNHNLFLDDAGLIAEAYRRQAERIAYGLPTEEEKKQAETAVRGQ